MIVETLIAKPAAGKTDAILRHVIETGERAVIASPTKQLSKQSFDKFTRWGGSGVIVDSDHCSSIGSTSKHVMMSSRNHNVIFITHATLLTLKNTKPLEGFSLYIDEVFKIVDFKRVNLKSHLELVTKYCEPLDETAQYNSLVLRDDCRDTVKSLLEEGYNGFDDISAGLYDLYTALLRNVPIKLTRESGNPMLFYINDFCNLDWRVFSKITIACANLHETFTGIILKHVNGWEFVESPLHSRLMFTDYVNTHRVKIHVLTNFDHWTKYKGQRVDNNGKTLYERVVDEAKRIFGKESFIYTTNKARGKISGGTYIQYNSHGLNSYIPETNVAALFSYNPQPWEVPVLEELSTLNGLDKDAFYRARLVSDYLEPTFQLCLRSNIRDQSSNKPVNLVVLDRMAADYLKRYLPDAEVIMCTVKESTQKRKQTYKFLYQFTAKEYNAFNGFKTRQKKKNGVELVFGDPVSDELVRQWVIEYRTKKDRYNP